MSDDTKALVAELRGSVRDATPLGHRQLIWQAADTIDRLERELAEAREIAQAKSEIRDEFYTVRQERKALAERCEKLREALREHEIKVLGVSDDGDGSVLYYCSWCDSDWLDSPEQHGPGCLAAPKDAP